MKRLVCALLIASISCLGCTGSAPNPTETPPIASKPIKTTKPIEISKSIETTKPIETTIWIPKSTITKPEELQTKRQHMIICLIREGIFDRIEMPGTLPHLWVGPTFMNLDFKTKKSFVEVVYAYYFDRPDRKQIEIWGDSVRIKDVFTGKDIGSYSLGNLDNPLKLK